MHWCFAALSANANLEKKAALLHTRFHVESADIPSLQAFIPREHLQKARFKAPVAGALDARFEEGWSLREANFDIAAGQLDILEVAALRLQAPGGRRARLIPLSLRRARFPKCPRITFRHSQQRVRHA